MCGIIGYTGSKQVRDILIDGLQKLEYRGYDSAGIALHNGSMQVIKSPGKVHDLVEILPPELDSNTGIAHTRWATHGGATELNAHPHTSSTGKLVLVHNGIIENSAQIEGFLKDKGYSFISETDTEILLNLIEYEYLANGKDIKSALVKTFSLVTGSYALAIIEEDKPGRITLCRKDSPLILGIDKTGFYVASDIYAVSEYAGHFIFPGNNDIIIVENKSQITVYDGHGNEKKADIKEFNAAKKKPDRCGYEHFMKKEIFEQPDILSDLVDSEYKIEGHLSSGKNFNDILHSISRITIIGCGTSWHAGLVARYIIEKYARIPVIVEYASEYRYRDPVINSHDLVISLSQSGETADTIAANRLAADAGAITMGILNVRNSSLDRETDFQVFLEAGDEIGVASTKAYTAQIIQLSRLASIIAALRGNEAKSQEILDALSQISSNLRYFLEKNSNIKDLAQKYASSSNFLFLGRGLNFPTALEGALKLKEISYIHAEGYPGAEMKHGPIALIDIDFPTMVILSDNENRTKMISNIKEIKARGGKVIAIINEGDTEAGQIVDDVIKMPAVPDIVSPVLSVVPLQLFAYYVALLRGCNVDQPRNLAKSVTVE